MATHASLSVLTSLGLALCLYHKMRSLEHRAQSAMCRSSWCGSCGAGVLRSVQLKPQLLVHDMAEMAV